MEDEPVYTEMYKGMMINIFPDMDAWESPEDWGDEELFLMSFHKDHPVMRDGVGCFADLKQFRKTHYLFPLLAIHNVRGLEAFALITYSPTPTAIGAVMVSRRLCNNRFDAMKRAASLIQQWNDYMQGNVFGYQIVDMKTDLEIGISGGFFGDWEMSGILDSARQEIDEYVVSEDYEREHKKK